MWLQQSVQPDQQADETELHLASQKHHKIQQKLGSYRLYRHIIHIGLQKYMRSDGGHLGIGKSAQRCQQPPGGSTWEITGNLPTKWPGSKMGTNAPMNIISFHIFYISVSYLYTSLHIPSKP